MEMDWLHVLELLNVMTVMLHQVHHLMMMMVTDHDDDESLPLFILHIDSNGMRIDNNKSGA
jgi:hypothetical protein